MPRTNPVTRVLITKSNQAVLTAGQPLSALAVGQIGVFDFETNLSITTGTARSFYLAVGVDDGTGALGDIVKSAGTHIQKRHITNVALRCYTPAQNKIIDLTDFKVNCDTDYGIKIGVANGAAYAYFGFDTPSKTFVVHSNCCTDACTACPEGDTNDVVGQMVAEINADKDGLLVASAISTSRTITIAGNASADGTIAFKLDGVTYSTAVLNGDTPTVAAGKVVTTINNLTDTKFFASNAAGVITVYPKTSTATVPVYAAISAATGETVTAAAQVKTVVTDIPTFAATNPGVNLGIRVEAKVAGVYNFATLNRKYDFIRGTNISMALVEGFNCNGTSTVVQEMLYEQGAGYDMSYEEDKNAGYAGAGNYRLSELLGQEISAPVNFADKAGKYLTYALTYDQESVSGFLEYKNNLLTLIGIPCGETTTISSLIPVLDALTANSFEALTDDSAACPSCTTVNFTSAFSRTTEGIPAAD